MKEAYKDKTIHTTPKGAWEGGVINERKEPSKKQKNNRKFLISLRKS